MTEIGNRIYPLGRDQRPNVCVRARVGAGGWQRKGGGFACCSAPCRQGGLTTGIIDKKQNPVRLGAERGPLGFGVSLCLHILTASQAADSLQLEAKQTRNRPSWNSTGNLFDSVGFFSSAGSTAFTGQSQFCCFRLPSRPRLCYHRLQPYCLKLTDSQ